MRSNSTLVVRDPFAEFDQLVRRSLGGFGGAGTSSGEDARPGFSPAVESHRDGDDAVLRLELPGVDVARDVEVEVRDHRLVVSGTRRDERSEETEGRRVSEFRYGSFRRSFRLGSGVSAEDVTASYDAGVLTLRIAGAYAEPVGQRIAISTTPAAQATQAIQPEQPEQAEQAEQADQAEQA